MAREVIQQCGVGLVSLQRDVHSRLPFAAPPLLRSGPLDDATFDETAVALGVTRDSVIDAAWIDNSPGWLEVLLDSAEEVLAIKPSNTHLKIGVIGPYEIGSPAVYEVQAFFPTGGTTFEDPVTAASMRPPHSG